MNWRCRTVFLYIESPERCSFLLLNNAFLYKRHTEQVTLVFLFSINTGRSVPTLSLLFQPMPSPLTTLPGQAKPTNYYTNQYLKILRSPLIFMFWSLSARQSDSQHRPASMASRPGGRPADTGLDENSQWSVDSGRGSRRSLAPGPVPTTSCSSTHGGSRSSRSRYPVPLPVFPA